MRQLTIFKLIRDPRNNDKVLRRQTLRIINVHDTFVGNGSKGAIIKFVFKKLADDLEPSNDGLLIS
jgi:hypothetical protein